MRLSKEIAKIIVDKMMAAIPYNINIMNENGIIIESGDKKRIGEVHRGAVEAIKKGTTVSIADPVLGTKPGVNMPILFKDEIIGVIGITGNLEIVKPFASLVKGSAELLVSQEYMFKERRFKEQLREEFLFEWIYRKDDFDHEFKSRGRDLGIDILKDRRAFLIKGVGKSRLNLNWLNDEEYKITISPDIYLILLLNTNDSLVRAKQIVGDLPVKSALGNKHIIIGKSFSEARRAVNIMDKIGIRSNVIEFNKVSYIDKITELKEDTALIRILEELGQTEKGMDLLDTLESFILNDGEVMKISKELHIHRNSLGYRISRIEQITGLDPRKYIDLYQLITAYICYKIKV